VTTQAHLLPGYQQTRSPKAQSIIASIMKKEICEIWPETAGEWKKETAHPLDAIWALLVALHSLSGGVPFFKKYR